jgi:hypothetical protein
MELGLFEDTKDAAADTRRKYPMSIVDSPPHRALAKQAAVRILLRIELSLTCITTAHIDSRSWLQQNRRGLFVC